MEDDFRIIISSEIASNSFNTINNEQEKRLKNGRFNSDVVNLLILRSLF